MNPADFAALQSRARTIADEEVSDHRMRSDPAAIERLAVMLEANPGAFDEGADMALLVASELRIQAAHWKTCQDADKTSVGG